MWKQLVGILIGLWLMASPAVLDYAGAAAVNDRIVGPLVASIACIAMWEVVRPLARLNVIAAIWLVLAPWILHYGSLERLHGVIAGVLLGVVAAWPPPPTRSFGGGWRALFGWGTTPP